jgi:hypothetical protein
MNQCPLISLDIISGILVLPSPTSYMLISFLGFMQVNVIAQFSLNVQPLPHCWIHYHMWINCMFINQKACVDVQIILVVSRIKVFYLGTYLVFGVHISLSAFAFMFSELVQYNQGQVECWGLTFVLGKQIKIEIARHPACVEVTSSKNFPATPSTLLNYSSLD